MAQRDAIAALPVSVRCGGAGGDGGRNAALKKREARRRKKEKDAHAAAERSAEIQARWGVADKAGKENDNVWPACEK